MKADDGLIQMPMEEQTMKLLDEGTFGGAIVTMPIFPVDSLEQSEENLRLNEQYYKAGTSSMSDLLEAQQLYQQSRDKYAEAYSKYKISKTEYLQAIGR